MPFVEWDIEQQQEIERDLPANEDVPMGEFFIRENFVWSGGFNPCYAICVYSTGGSRMLLCHADDTYGDNDGETAVRWCIAGLIRAEADAGVVITAEETRICVIKSGNSNHVGEAQGIADEAREIELPDPEPDLWTMEVYMYPGGKIRYALFDMS